MGFPCFMAMTAQEMENNALLQAPIAYMACHFSIYENSLSHCPSQLSEGSVLILNDRIPPLNHDPQIIAAQLQQLVDTFSCQAVLLDFQRPGDPQTEIMAAELPQLLHCPVVVSAEYGKALSCPVFLPAPAPYVPLDAYCAPWQSREIWLEAALTQQELTLTENGCQTREVPVTASPLPHRDDALCCHYGIREAEDAVLFTLQRTGEDLRDLLSQAQQLGITAAVGLYQQLKP